MRPAEFGPESIIEAGQALQAARRNITGFALRQKVGGGNPSRLKQIWDEHLAGQSVSKVEPVAELPLEVAEEMAAVTKALTERLAQLAVELNDKAVKAAERRVHEVVRAAGEHREQAERELADASQTVDDLETRLDQVTTEAGELKRQLVDVQASSQAQAVELAQLRERTLVTEQAGKAAEIQHSAELSRIGAALEAERTRNRREADQLRAELNDQKQAIQTTAAERDQARAELAAVKIQMDTTEREARFASERLAQCDAEQVRSREETASAREEAAMLRGQVESMKSQITDLMQVLGERATLKPGS